MFNNEVTFLSYLHSIMEKKMFLGASPELFKNAKELRENETKQEKILWQYLKGKPMGFKFRRQHPVKWYIVDFYCHFLKLVIEVDGGIHDLKQVKLHDIERQKFLEKDGLTFLRFSNQQIEKDFESVKTAIETQLISNK
jgi:cyclase